MLSKRNITYNTLDVVSIDNYQCQINANHQEYQTLLTVTVSLRNIQQQPSIASTKGLNDRNITKTVKQNIPTST